MNTFRAGLSRYFPPAWLAFARTIPIALIGAGGLGSNCAMHLLRSGFTHFTIFDPDNLEASNLNRQFYFLHQVGQPKVEALKENLQAINPDAQISSYQQSFLPEHLPLLADCQAVVEAVDKAQTKKMLFDLLAGTKILTVFASGMGGMQVSERAQKRVLGQTTIVGDLQTPCTEKTPPYSPGVGIVAAMQAETVLEYFFTSWKNATENMQ